MTSDQCREMLDRLAAFRADPSYDRRSRDAVTDAMVKTLRERLKSPEPCRLADVLADVQAGAERRLARRMGRAVARAAGE